MKKILPIIAFAACLFSRSALADFGMLATEDGTCRFFYPTVKNTQGWYIKPSSPDMCQNGFLNKHGEVTIYNAFSIPVEQFYGFFNGGYWMGQTNLSAEIVTARSENNNVYKVSFALPSETGFDIRYLSQMTSKKTDGKTYGSFTFCNPFRILIQTDDFGLFKDKKLTTEIIDEVARHAQRLCPTEQAIQLFGSPKENPKQEDIFFYADINLQTAQIDVKRNEATAFAEKFEEKAETDTPLEQIQTASDYASVQTGPASSSDISSPASNIEIIIPVPKTDQSVSTEVPENNNQIFDKIPHLLTLSRLTKTPVHGTTVVHIVKATDTHAETAVPLPLTLNGKDLKIGWAIISGDFKHETGKKTTELTGSVEVKSFIPCTKEYCTDIQ